LILSKATEASDLSLDRRATSVAVTPVLRARSQATRSVELASTRSRWFGAGSSQRESMGCTKVTPLFSRVERLSAEPTHTTMASMLSGDSAWWMASMLAPITAAFPPARVCTIERCSVASGMLRV